MESKSSEFNAFEIARILNTLNDASVTTIFLGAKAGALFRSQHLYNQLKSFGNQSLYSFPLLERFKQCYQILTSNYDAHNIQGILESNALLKEIRPEMPELCVAQLMKKGIFKYILSTGVHKEFEQAFERMEMERNRDFTMYWPRRHKEMPSGAENQQGIFTFYKLFGDVHDGCTIKDRLDYMEEYKDLARIADGLRTVNMLIIGLDATWDRDIIPALFPRSGMTWYVNDEEPQENEPLREYIKKSNVKCFLGPDGRYDNFIRELCWHMTSSMPVNQAALAILEEIRNEVRANQRTLQRLSEETEELRRLGEEREVLRIELGQLLTSSTRRNITEER